MKMRKYNYLILLISVLSFFSCEKFLEPQRENTLSEDITLADRSMAEGILLTAYIALPNDYYFETDVASDDAITNDINSSYRRMATGEWKSSYDPISIWASSYQQIYYINKFMDVCDKVTWAYDYRMTKKENATRDSLYKNRLLGEAFALRAWYKAKLLQSHSGKVSDGTLLGFPILDNSISFSDDWRLPRNTFAECVSSIFKDADSAIARLPKTWEDLLTGGANPPINVFKNAIQGAKYENRINGNIVRALKARVALLAASPSFSASSGVVWDSAAVLAGALLTDLGPLYVKPATSNNVAFYKERKNPEMLWNRAVASKRNWEQNNFPPSKYGYGQTNPSQSLVDAFPMNNGYPITHISSTYNPDNPYINRDNRFNQYIIYNNATLGGTKIFTHSASDLDGINKTTLSTRTGYYLKKFMVETINLNPNSPTSADHTYTLVRMTELLLNYAEAANEAWGPDADLSGRGYGTARSKISELRNLAGITTDLYLPTLTTKEEFRELIRNERRISLCFEGFRFWDIRRWGDEVTMTAPVKGVVIHQVDGVDTTYSYQDVEERKYTTDMIYGPIPYSEILKYSLQQNNGW